MAWTDAFVSFLCASVVLGAGEAEEVVWEGDVEAGEEVDFVGMVVWVVESHEVSWAESSV